MEWLICRWNIGKIEIVFHNEEGCHTVVHEEIYKFRKLYQNRWRKFKKSGRNWRNKESGYIYSGVQVYLAEWGANYSGSLPARQLDVLNFYLIRRRIYKWSENDHGKTTWGIEGEARSHGYTGDMRNLTQDFTRIYFIKIII